MPFDGSLQSEQAVATHEDWDLQGLSWDRREDRQEMWVRAQARC